MEEFDAIATGVIKHINYITYISTSGHEILADENAEHMGADKGPQPYELLASALVACTCMTLRMYAQRKEWNTGEIKVEVKIKYNNENKSTIFERHIFFENELKKEQKERLLTIANKCPVHNILTSNIRVQTALS
jgi:putative redox protein